jgi:probable HAF family extracellular repeat protein
LIAPGGSIAQIFIRPRNPQSGVQSGGWPETPSPSARIRRGTALTSHRHELTTCGEPPVGSWDRRSSEPSSGPIRAARRLHNLTPVNMKLPATILVLILALGRTGAASDDQLFFMALPPNVLPSAVGGNAFAVVGSFFGGGALYWIPTSGTSDIGGRSGVAVSVDGRTIIGVALDANGLENAAIWRGGRQWHVLGSFAPDSRPCDQLLSGAFGASADGRVVVGLGWDGCRYAHAFRWEQSTGMIDLGSTTANSTRANNVSGNGQIVVGWQEDAFGFRQAAKWVALRQELIRGPNGALGEAFAANFDGSLIVGKQCDPTSATPTAWKWTTSTGVHCYPITVPPTLPPLPYLAAMLATSDDGGVIGGALSFGLDSEALIWLDGQAYFLRQYLREHGYPDAFRGWVNTGFITGVSPDGRTLVGYGAGPTTLQGYLVILPKRDPR